MSYTRTQFGWCTAASARASRSIRASVSASGACASFTATVRSSWVSFASHTVPKPPWPSGLIFWNRPPLFCHSPVGAFGGPAANGSGPGSAASFASAARSVSGSRCWVATRVGGGIRAGCCWGGGW